MQLMAETTSDLVISVTDLYGVKAEVQTLAEMHGLPVYLVGFAAGLTGNMAMVGGPRDHSSVESAVLSKILKIVDDNLW